MTDWFKTLVDIARPVVLCEDCEKRPAVAGEDLCPDCRDNRAEAAWERAQEEPCFRGGEWTAAQREEALRIKRDLKS